MLRRISSRILLGGAVASASPASEEANSNRSQPSSSCRISPCTHDPWENLQGMLVAAKHNKPADVFKDKPLALGTLVERVSDTRYRVKFRAPSPTSNGGVLPGSGEAHPPLTLDIGTRVKLFYGSRDYNMLLGGVIAKVNGNGTYTVLMENDEIELSVSPERIAERDGETKVLHNAKFIELTEWLRSSIRDPRDCEAVSYILFHRGWRVERMYLLEKNDLSPMVFLSKMEMEGVMEKAKWEHDHHNVIRLLHRERVKDRDFRYALSKYKGTLSCITGICVVTYVFFHNLRAYRKQQRGYQLQLAADTLAKSRLVGRSAAESGPLVYREAEEEQTRGVLQQLNTAHPRIVVFTGYSGSGISPLCRVAIEKEGVPAVFVDVRGAEDTLKSVVKAFGVQNIEVCGDLMDFVAEALHVSTAKDCIPLLVIKLRKGSSLEKVYREAVGLVSEYQVCHILLETSLESLMESNAVLPRLDYYLVPQFTKAQAFEYTQQKLDPLDLTYFMDTVGTNINDLDELYASVKQRGMDAVGYTSLKLMKAMRRIQVLMNEQPVVIQDLIRQLATPSFDEGLPEELVEDVALLHDPSLKDIVLYDPVRDRWLFAQKVLHTAVRCGMPVSEDA